MIIQPILGIWIHSLDFSLQGTPREYYSLDSIKDPSTYHLRNQAKKRPGREPHVSFSPPICGSILPPVSAKLSAAWSSVVAESHERATKKTRPYFPLCWLFNRNPSNGLRFATVPTELGRMIMYNPLYILNNQGSFFDCSLVGACFQGDTTSSPPCYLFFKGLKHCFETEIHEKGVSLSRMSQHRPYHL